MHFHVKNILRQSEILYSNARLCQLEQWSDYLTQIKTSDNNFQIFVAFNEAHFPPHMYLYAGVLSCECNKAISIAFTVSNTMQITVNILCGIKYLL